MRGVVPGVILTLLLIGMIASSFNIQLAKSEPKTIIVPNSYTTRQELINASNMVGMERDLTKRWSIQALKSNLKKGWNTRLTNAFGLSLGAWERSDFQNEMEWRDFSRVDDDSLELIVGLDYVRSGSYSELAELITSIDGQVVNTVSIGGMTWAVVADIPSMVVSNFVSELETAKISRYIEPNVRFEIDFVPNDPDWPKQWGLQKIEADWAWNTTKGDQSVIVAVIDTGVDWNHPDLVDNYVPLGYDWVNNDPDPMDDHGHGTHCAGVIAAVIDNDIGIAGLAQVYVMAEKGLDESGSGSLDDLAMAIVHAVDQGADIISCSWGSYRKSTLLYEAVRYAHDHGVLVIAAAGNDATDIKHYPAAYDEVVSVAATDQYDNPANFSNFGDWVDVAAPGVSIYSTVWDDSYAYMDGTSMSVPHVSGVAALIWSQFPYMTRDQVRAQLQFSADDLGSSGFDVYYGYGRVNARRAVEQAPPDHDVCLLSVKMSSYVKLGNVATINTTILNLGKSDESAITVQFLVNNSLVDSQIVDFLASGSHASVRHLWTPTIQGVYNVTPYILPLMGETNVDNNAFFTLVSVRIPQVIRVPHDYAKIQDAVDAASERDTIYVASGTYYENIWINKEDLTLAGADRSNTIIDGNQTYDVIFVTVDNVRISNFTIRNSGISPYYYPLVSGILLYYSQGDAISNLTILGNYMGIGLFCSGGITLRDINMISNVYNFGVEGYSLSDYIHDVDNSNTVDGKPVVYFVNEHNKEVPSDAGYVALVNSTNIIVEDLNLTKNFESVLFAYASDCTIRNVFASASYVGAYLTHSSVALVQNNVIVNNSEGIYLNHARDNKVSNNTVMNNQDGINLYCSDANMISFNNLLNNDLGLFLEKSNDNAISSNEISENRYGIYLRRSTHDALRNNNMTINPYNFGVIGTHLLHYIHDIDNSNIIDGKPLYYLIDRHDLVIDSATVPDIGYLGIINSKNITLRNLNLTKNIQGVLLAYCNDSLLTDLNISSNIWGVLMVSSFTNIITRGVIAKNEYGVEMRYCYSNTIQANTVTNGTYSICLQSSTNNDVVNNAIITNEVYGIRLLYSESNNVRNNTLTKNGYGIVLDHSGGNSLTHNNMSSNDYNFGVSGRTLSDYVQDIDGSNTVDEKPIYYWVNQHDKLVPANAGYVAVVNSTNITIKNLNLASNVQSVLFAYVANSIISGNSITDNDDSGIILYYSHTNIISNNMAADSGIGISIWASNGNNFNGNMLSRNIIGIGSYHSDDNDVINNKVSGGERGLAGLVLTESRANVIKRNEIADNTYVIGAGIHLEWSSDNNTVIENIVKGNGYGITLGYWGLYGPKDQNNNNAIYHNDLIENTKQVLSLNSINTWDDGYPSGGNYWSDYAGVDLFGGHYQNMSGSDSIGDDPYIIDENNKDNYPLMCAHGFGDLNDDGLINLLDLTIFGKAFGSHPGHPRWNSVADLDGNDFINILDGLIIAKNFGKIALK